MNQFTFYQSDVRGETTIVGSSDIATLCGLTKRTALEKWEVDTGRAERWGGNEFTETGHDLEPIVISRFIKRFYDDPKMAYKYKIDHILHENHRSPDYKPATIFYPFTEAVHPQFPWAIAHSDALNIEEGYDVEAKTGGYFARIRRSDMQDGFDIEDETENAIPPSVMLQKQWQFMCYDIDYGYVGLMIDDNKFYFWKVEAKKNWYPKMLEIGSRYMWCIKNDKPPMPKHFGDVMKIFPEVQERTTYLVGEKAQSARLMYDDYKEITKRMKKLKAKKDDITNAFALLMEDNKYLFDGETAEKICTQVYSQNLVNPLHPNSIKKADEKIYEQLEKLGLISYSDRRYIR